MKQVVSISFALIMLIGCAIGKSKPKYLFGTELDCSDHYEVNVEWRNDAATLAGTLYLPKDSLVKGTIIFVAGSGPTERLLYEYGGQWVQFINPREYVQAGYALFSYDKRGVGQSTGEFSDQMTEANYFQLGSDALSALRTIKNYDKIDADKVGFLGVSQAGWTIPVIAKTTDEMAFIIIINGPTCTTEEEELYSFMTSDDPAKERLKQKCCCINLDSIYKILEHNRQQVNFYQGYSSYQDLILIDEPCLFIHGLRDLSQPARLCVEDLQEIINEYNKNWKILAFENADHYLLQGNGRCLLNHNQDLTFELNYIVDWKMPTFHWLDSLLH